MGRFLVIILLGAVILGGAVGCSKSTTAAPGESKELKPGRIPEPPK